MTQLQGRAALVTGGNRGIGAATAIKLAREGADVAFTYRGAADRAAGTTAAITATGRRAVALQADLTGAEAASDAVERTVAQLGRLDILVNNAGVFPTGPLDGVTPEELDRTLALHVRAVFLASQAAARRMADGGRIISVGSNLADVVPSPGLTLYAMSKAALIGLTRGLARDLGPRGITATVVHPGSTDTEMNPADGPDADAERERTALGTYLDPADIATTIAHLAGPGGRHLTGTAITVDAGANA